MKKEYHTLARLKTSCQRGYGGIGRRARFSYRYLSEKSREKRSSAPGPSRRAEKGEKHANADMAELADAHGSAPVTSVMS